MTGGGHFIYLERPDTFAETVSAFVDEAGGKTP